MEILLYIFSLYAITTMIWASFIMRHETNETTLTLSIPTSYLFGAPSKGQNCSCSIFIDVHLVMLTAIYFYFLHNVSTLNECTKVSFV